MKQQVYVVQSEAGLVKIGISKSLKNRLSGLMSASGLKIELKASFDCGRARAVEKAAHGILAAHRKRGEWFDVTPEAARAAIEMAISALSAQADAIRMTGAELQHLRQTQFRLKQAALGKIVDVHFTTISDWEREDREIPQGPALIFRLMADDVVLRERIIEMAGA